MARHTHQQLPQQHQSRRLLHTLQQAQPHQQKQQQHAVEEQAQQQQQQQQLLLGRLPYFASRKRSAPPPCSSLFLTSVHAQNTSNNNGNNSKGNNGSSSSTATAGSEGHRNGKLSRSKTMPFASLADGGIRENKKLTPPPSVGACTVSKIAHLASKSRGLLACKNSHLLLQQKQPQPQRQPNDSPDQQEQQLRQQLCNDSDGKIGVCDVLDIAEKCRLMITDTSIAYTPDRGLDNVHNAVLAQSSYCQEAYKADKTFPGDYTKGNKRISSTGRDLIIGVLQNVAGYLNIHNNNSHTQQQSDNNNNNNNTITNVLDPRTTSTYGVSVSLFDRFMSVVSIHDDAYGSNGDNPQHALRGLCGRSGLSPLLLNQLIAISCYSLADRFDAITPTDQSTIVDVWRQHCSGMLRIAWPQQYSYNNVFKSKLLQIERSIICFVPPSGHIAISPLSELTEALMNVGYLFATTYYRNNIINIKELQLKCQFDKNKFTNDNTSCNELHDNTNIMVKRTDTVKTPSTVASASKSISSSSSTSTSSTATSSPSSPLLSVSSSSTLDAPLPDPFSVAFPPTSSVSSPPLTTTPLHPSHQKYTKEQHTPIRNENNNNISSNTKSSIADIPNGDSVPMALELRVSGSRESDIPRQLSQLLVRLACIDSRIILKYKPSIIASAAAQLSMFPPCTLSYALSGNNKINNTNESNELSPQNITYNKKNIENNNHTNNNNVNGNKIYNSNNIIIDPIKQKYLLRKSFEKASAAIAAAGGSNSCKLIIQCQRLMIDKWNSIYNIMNNKINNNINNNNNQQNQCKDDRGCNRSMGIWIHNYLTLKCHKYVLLIIQKHSIALSRSTQLLLKKKNNNNNIHTNNNTNDNTNNNNTKTDKYNNININTNTEIATVIPTKGIILDTEVGGEGGGSVGSIGKDNVEAKTEHILLKQQNKQKQIQKQQHILSYSFLRNTDENRSTAF